jgi:hypothetical protein
MNNLPETKIRYVYHYKVDGTWYYSEPKLTVDDVLKFKSAKVKMHGLSAGNDYITTETVISEEYQEKITLKQLGAYVRSFDGRKMGVAQIQLFVPKDQAVIEFYGSYEGPSDGKPWIFNWSTCPIDSKSFSMLVTDVYDIPEVDYYSVTINLVENLTISLFCEFLVSPKNINWEELCNPWNDFTHYSWVT